MRKYIFITPHLDGMGGAQMYLYSKYKTLKEQGWDVSVIYASQRSSILPIFKDLNDVIPEIAFATNVYTHNKIQKLLNKIISRHVSSNYDEIIIESTCIPQCTWGEALAQKINAKHICYLLQENNTITEEYVDFFLFKQMRGELAGIKEVAIERMFNPFRHLKVGEAKKLVAYGCGNTVDNVDYQFVDEIERLETDYKIASIGRLNKPFVMPMLKALKEYIIAHHDKTFYVVMLGGSPHCMDIKQIEDLFKDISNCSLKITGYLFPLPRKVFNLIDVFISSAGSAGVSNREGAITISYDGIDCKPIGILGHTTNNSLFRAVNEPPLELTALLDDVLIKHKYTRKEPIGYKTLDYTPHFDFIRNSEQKREYFDIYRVKSSSLKGKMRSLIIQILGHKFYIKMSKIKNHTKF